MHGSRHGQGAQIARLLTSQREGRVRKCPAFLRSGEGFHASSLLARPLAARERDSAGLAVWAVFRESPCTAECLPAPDFRPNRSFSRLPSGGLQFRASCFSLARHLLFWPRGKLVAGLILPQQCDNLRIREKLAATFHLPVICFSLARHLLFFIMKT